MVLVIRVASVITCFNCSDSERTGHYRGGKAAKETRKQDRRSTSAESGNPIVKSLKEAM